MAVRLQPRLQDISKQDFSCLEYSTIRELLKRTSDKKLEILGYLEEKEQCPLIIMHSVYQDMML